jgi:hypothetical protein
MQLHRTVMVYNLIRAKIHAGAATGTQTFIQHVFSQKTLTARFNFGIHSSSRFLKVRFYILS